MQDELNVMKAIADLLEPLDVRARSRVLSWITSALDVGGVQQPAAPLGAGATAVSQPSIRADIGFATFAELFHAARPQSEKEKALVAAYWIQRSGGVEQFAAQQLNTELKHIGYGVINITDALNQLIGDRPSLVIQLMKGGSTKQARKTYKMTDAGMRRVNEMLNSAD